MLSIGSLFSGIGGLELGLERAGMGPVVWQAEQDPYCRRVLAKHWPSARRYEDVRDIDSEAARVDVICGGFPCQDISLAGKGAGLAGERSGLWREYARIIRELRPRYVVVENVAALLARGLGDVLGDLAACGYDAQWDCIPAAAVGAPHRRDRVFLVAYANSAQRARNRLPIGYEAPLPRGGVSCGTGITGNTDRDRESTVTSDAKVAQLQSVAGDTPTWPAPPALCGMAHGVPDRSHRLRALGNAVVPQVAEVVGRVVMAMEAANA